MPPEMQSGMNKEQEKDRDSGSSKGHRPHKERLGNYVVGAEIGRGSFATVYKGYRSKTKAPIAIKAVSRQKLTTKLLENLESEINILKVISHRNIVALEDCFKNDTHIYLVMEYCSGSDLSIYIKNRGRLATLDFFPLAGRNLPPVTFDHMAVAAMERRALEGKKEGDHGSLRPADGKVFWPHPLTGGLDERVARCFLGQLAMALKFLRSQDLMHRDIKPQNLLLQPASEEEVAQGHPYGIPMLKVADFGFARILPAAAMAETLCGSPLYMAPEILRYEKYDAKADLWSVGAVLFEMVVGRPPFRANNHVELLRKIEKGEDRIKFPDESSRNEEKEVRAQPVSGDVKALIRGLLKRHRAERMGFEEFFGCQVWEGYLVESREMVSSREASTEESTSLDVSTDAEMGSTSGEEVKQSEVNELLQRERQRDQNRATLEGLAPQPVAQDPALNPQPAPRPPLHARQSSDKSDEQERRSTPTDEAARPRRSGPSYYVAEEPAPSPPSPSIPSGQAIPSPTRRRLSSKSSHHRPEDIVSSRGRVSSGSPLAATPPFTLRSETGKDQSALEGDDSVVGREYVMVDKEATEVNKLADEVEQASRRPGFIGRRTSSRVSVVTRPVSSFKPSPSPTQQVQPLPPAGVAASPPSRPDQAVIRRPSPTTIAPNPERSLIPASYSPPFGLSPPPFAIPVHKRASSSSLARPTPPPQIQGVTILPTPSPTPGIGTTFPPTTIPYDQPRYGSSPSSLQTGALARALTSTAMRLINNSASVASTALAKAAASRRRPTITRTAEIDPAEEGLLSYVEDQARKAFALFELADQRLVTWHQLARPIAGGSPQSGLGITPPDGLRRKSSGSSVSSELLILRQQEKAAGEAVVLYLRSLGFLVRGISTVSGYWQGEGNGHAGVELNEMVQWLRARFNECMEKAEWAKSRCAEELPFVEKLLQDKARELSRQAALAELSNDLGSAEAGYETALWLLQALLDDADSAEMGGSSEYVGAPVDPDRPRGGKDREREGVERMLGPVKNRLEALRRKTALTGASIKA